MTTYRPNRNIVRRHLDGKQVNVARARGQIFVCANACCCGRVDLTNAPVPVERYHEEWTRRRMRNFVHLTIGGCLGPCALANVAMLLFDARATWFHSMNDEEAVVALFDYVESLLDEGSFRLPGGALESHAFTGYQWEGRPDGAPVDDHRRWRGRSLRPDATPSCELEPADLQVAATAGADTAPPTASELPFEGPAAPPRANGELVFHAPWEGRAFGMAASLSESGAFAWDAFRERLIAEIAANEASGEPFDYYGNWLRAFESLLEAEGIITGEELAERTAEFEFGERAEVY